MYYQAFVITILCLLCFAAMFYLRRIRSTKYSAIISTLLMVGMYILLSLAFIAGLLIDILKALQ